jgi:type IV pilus assembly protein PilC
MSKLISPANGALLYRQVAAAVRNKLPLDDLFAILAEDAGLFGADAPAISLLQKAMQDARRLPDAMARLPDLFDAATADLVRKADDCGQLEEVLEALASEQIDLAQAGSAMRTALTWPSVLLSVALIIVASLMIFVIPAFKEVFSSFGSDLPAMTLTVMAASDFFVHWWYVVGGAIAVLVFLQRRKLFPPFWSLQMERLILTAPFVRNYVMRVFGAQLLRWLLVCSIAPDLLQPLLRHIQATTKWKVLQGLAAELAARLAAGQSVGQALDRLPPLPQSLGLRVRLGEKTGDIGNALAQGLETAELELAHALTRHERGVFLTCYLTIALFVGYMVIALYLPIFRLGSVI